MQRHSFAVLHAAVVAASVAAQATTVIQFPSIPPYNNAANQVTRCFSMPDHSPLTLDAREIVIGDVDGDGDKDVFAIGGRTRLYINGIPDPSAGAVIETLPSQPFGTFFDWTLNGAQERVNQLTSNGTDGFLADMDLDGDPDLVLCSDTPLGGSVMMLLNTSITNNGGTSFAGPLRYFDATVVATWVIDPAGMNVLLHGIAPTDFDNDGDTDCVVGTSSGLLLYRNDRHLAPPKLTRVVLSPGFTGNVNDVVVADLDATGGPDIAAAVSGGPDRVFLSSAAYAPVSLAQPAGNGDLGLAIAAGNVAGNGAIDLVIGHAPSATAFGHDVVYVNDGAGNFALQQVLVKLNQNSSDVELFDLDDDSRLDLVTATSTPQGRTQLWHGTASGFVSLSNRIANDTGYESEAIGVADVDQDLDVDVLIGYHAQARLGMFPNHLWQHDADRSQPANGGTVTIDTYIKAGFSTGGASETWVTTTPPAMPNTPGAFGYLVVGAGWTALGYLPHPLGSGTVVRTCGPLYVPPGTRYWMQSLLFRDGIVRASNVTETVMP